MAQSNGQRALGHLSRTAIAIAMRWSPRCDRAPRKGAPSMRRLCGPSRTTIPQAATRAPSGPGGRTPSRAALRVPRSGSGLRPSRATNSAGNSSIMSGTSDSGSATPSGGVAHAQVGDRFAALQPGVRPTMSAHQRSADNRPGASDSRDRLEQQFRARHDRAATKRMPQRRSRPGPRQPSQLDCARFEMDLVAFDLQGHPNAARIFSV